MADENETVVCNTNNTIDGDDSASRAAQNKVSTLAANKPEAAEAAAENENTNKTEEHDVLPPAEAENKNTNHTRVFEETAPQEAKENTLTNDHAEDLNYLSNMHPLKAFVTKLRQIELIEPYFFINVNTSPYIYENLQLLENIKFKDGQYHTYSGELTVAINNFMNYWCDTMDKCVIEVDTLENTTDKKGMVQLIQNSIDIQQLKQKEYLEQFGEPGSEENQKVLDHLTELTNNRLEYFREMASKVPKMDNNKVANLLSQHLNVSILKTNEAFELFHTWIATQLAEYSPRVKVSFEEILLRMRNNLKSLEEEESVMLREHMTELYEANKEQMFVSRQEHHRFSDMATVQFVINNINNRNKQRHHHLHNTLEQIKEEVAYWEKKTSEVQSLERAIREIKTEIKNITEYMNQCDSMRTTEYPGSKKTCWENMGANYRHRKIYLQQKLMDAAKALLTFFVNGRNVIYYEDKFGLYSIDKYGHQIYAFDEKQKAFHTTCDNELVKISDTDKYYYDSIGKYTLDDKGTKIYQHAPCCSKYNLNEHELLVKTTEDCGHSEIPNPECGLRIKNPNLIEILPAAEPVDIKQTLTPETSEYLWHSLACVLVDALSDTDKKQPLNPIHYLANRLFAYKYYKNNIPQLKTKVKQADKYKANIYKMRKENAIAEAKAYKEKLQKRCKPEDLDNTENMQAFAAFQEISNQQYHYDY